MNSVIQHQTDNEKDFPFIGSWWPNGWVLHPRTANDTKGYPRARYHPQTLLCLHVTIRGHITILQPKICGPPNTQTCIPYPFIQMQYIPIDY